MGGRRAAARLALAAVVSSAGAILFLSVLYGLGRIG